MQVPEQIGSDVLKRLPIFPLPDAVLFPGVVLPLHVFEPRYRGLVEHCLATHRTMAIATLQPGYEREYEGRPAVHRVMGAGVIIGEARLPDGRWNIALKGVERVRMLHEHPADEPYRVIAARRLPSESGPNDSALADRLKGFVVTLSRLLPYVGPQLSELLRDATSPSQVVDVISGYFVEDPALRRALLEETSVERRVDRVQDVLAGLLLDVAGNDDDAMIN